MEGSGNAPRSVSRSGGGSGGIAGGRSAGGGPRRTGRLPRLHVIAGDSVVGSADYRRRLRPVIEAGGGELALHLRARGTPASRLYEVAAWLGQTLRRAGASPAAGLTHAEREPDTVGAASGKGTLVVVNDRVDIALASGVGGVHLREDSISPEVVRALSGDALLIGRSIHAASQADDLRGRGLDYLVMGAAYRTPSHPGRVPAGPKAVADAAARADVPVLAIGGVTPARVPEMVDRGVYGIVVKSGVWTGRTPARGVTRYLESLHRRI